MFASLTRAQVRRVFKSLDEGDYHVALAGMATKFEHRFLGDHSLGGERHTAQGLRRWFERLFRLNRRLRFNLHHVAVAGWPWDATVTVEWEDGAELATGKPYLNRGVHVIRMRWGKAVSIHAYLDTAIWQKACADMAEAGIPEAVAPPITD